MPFQIPNRGTASFEDQSEPDSTDIDVLVAGYARTGVKSGCEVTAQATPDMTVAVAGGEILVDGVSATVTAGNLTINNANITNPRKDLVVASNAGVLSVVAGTAANDPLQPAVPAASVALAQIYVPANDTTINSTQITDRRILIGVLTDADIPAGIARDAEVTTAVSNHEAAVDPHTGYQRESEKGVANGYASLDAQAEVPTTQLGTGTAGVSTFLRGDQSWASPTPHQLFLSSYTTGDAKVVNDAAMTASSAVLTLPSSGRPAGAATFTANDVGKPIIVGEALGGGDLRTTIASYTSALSVTLTASATSTVSGKGASWGTDAGAGLQALLDDLVSLNGPAEGVIDGRFLLRTGVSANMENKSIYIRLVGGGTGSWLLIQTGTASAGVAFYNGSVCLDGITFVGTPNVRDESLCALRFDVCRVLIDRCQFFGITAVDDAASASVIFATGSMFTCRWTSFRGCSGNSANGKSVVRSILVGSFAVDSCDFVDYGTLDGILHSKTPLSKCHAWLAVGSPSASPAAGIFDQGAVSVTNTKFDEGAWYGAVDVQGVPNRFHRVHIDGIEVNVPNVADGRGVAFFGIDEVVIESSWFGYTTGTVRDAIWLDDCRNTRISKTWATQTANRITANSACVSLTVEDCVYTTLASSAARTTVIRDGAVDRTWLRETTASGTPATGLVAVYAKSDGRVYIKDDAGTETDLTPATHEAAADPHTGYQRESEKDTANGYAGLDANTRVLDAQLGTGTASATTFLRGDRSWTSTNSGLVFPVSHDSAGAATDDILRSKLTADTQYRFILNADGLLEWGPGGSTAPDTTLTRQGAGVLQVGSQAIVVTNDARLSDARTPTAHASTHTRGSADALGLDSTVQLTTAVTNSTVNGSYPDGVGYWKSVTTADSWPVDGFLYGFRSGNFHAQQLQDRGNGDVRYRIWIQGLGWQAWFTTPTALTYDAKGDLVVGTGTDAYARLAVGTRNDQLLLVDSATATGLRYGQALTSGPTAPTSPVTGDLWVDTSTSLPEITLRRKTADQSVSSTSLADDTHLTFSIIANAEYIIEVSMYVVAESTATGAAVSLNGPASPTHLTYTAHGQLTQGTGGAASTFFAGGATTYNTILLGNGVPSTTVPALVTINGYLVNGVNAGTLVVRIAAEVAASITYRRGSWARLTRVA